MKNNNTLLIFFLGSFFLYSCTATGEHDGRYVFTDSSYSPVLEESISIHGSSATLRFRSLFNKANLSKSKYLCFQRPGKIDLYLGKREPPLSIPVDQEGNLVWDNKLFKREQLQLPLLHPLPDFSKEKTK